VSPRPGRCCHVEGHATPRRSRARASSRGRLSRESRSALLSRCAAILAALSALDEPSTGDHIAAGGPAEPERLLTVPEVAELLGFARGYVYELLRRGISVRSITASTGGSARLQSRSSSEATRDAARRRVP